MQFLYAENIVFRDTILILCMFAQKYIPLNSIGSTPGLCVGLQLQSYKEVETIFGATHM